MAHHPETVQLNKLQVLYYQYPDTVNSQLLNILNQYLFSFTELSIVFT